MNIKDQVCSLEFAERLKELGVRQESAFVWSLDIVDGYCLVLREVQDPNVGPSDPAAFTVAELGEMLEPWANRVYKSWTWKDENGELSYVCEEYDPDPSIGDEQETFYADTEANARAKMLIYLIEQGLILDGKGKVKG